MSRHRYPADTIWADYARGGAGLALTLGPLLVLTPHWLVSAGLAAAALLFAVFLSRTALRQLTVVELDERGVAARGSGVEWAALQGLRLTYYSTRRDRRNGWMQMTLKGPGRALRLESTLTGFDEIAEHAAAAAAAKGLRLDDATVDNLLALGIDAGRGAEGGRAGAER